MVSGSSFVVRVDCSTDERRTTTDETGAVAQLGERRNRTAEVGGSIPLGSTMRSGPQSGRIDEVNSRIECLGAYRCEGLVVGGSSFVARVFVIRPTNNDQRTTRSFDILEKQRFARAFCLCLFCKNREEKMVSG